MKHHFYQSKNNYRPRVSRSFFVYWPNDSSISSVNILDHFDESLAERSIVKKCKSLEEADAASYGLPPQKTYIYRVSHKASKRRKKRSNNGAGSYGDLAKLRRKNRGHK